jgi:hypothetical protein
MLQMGVLILGQNSNFAQLLGQGLVLHDYFAVVLDEIVEHCLNEVAVFIAFYCLLKNTQHLAYL